MWARYRMEYLFTVTAVYIRTTLKFWVNAWNKKVSEFSSKDYRFLQLAAELAQIYNTIAHIRIPLLTVVEICYCIPPILWWSWA